MRRNRACYNRTTNEEANTVLKKTHYPAALLAVLQLSACSPSADRNNDVENLDAAARRIASDYLIVDTHIDLPYRLTLGPGDVSQATADGDFDYPRALSGGLNAPFMSIYTPAELEASGESKKTANELIDRVERIVRESPDKFALALSPADVRRNFENNLMSLPLGMENGSPIEGDLSNLAYFHARGIRYITPAHSLSNHISDSSYDDQRPWQGLSEFGVSVIREMNRLGIMIDVSHVSDKAFWQILEITKVPPIASHSSARRFTPGFERNMSDEMIVALAEAGGVIQINFGSTFVSQEARSYYDARSKAGKAYLAAHPELNESFLDTDYPAIYAEQHGPLPFANVETVLDHFDHVVALTGVEHVGIGSDYDGVGDTLPIGLKDVAAYPNLIKGLLQRGYSEDDIAGILAENVLRVWQAAEDYAAATTSSST